MAPGMLTVYPKHPQKPTFLEALVTPLVIPALAMDAGSSIQAEMDSSYSQAKDQSTMASDSSSHQAMHHEEESAFVNHPSTTAEIEAINRAIDKFTNRFNYSSRSSELDAEGYLRLHAPDIAHAFGPELADGVRFSLENGQLHLLYGRSCKFRITPVSRLKEAIRNLRAAWIHRLAFKRRVEFALATKPSTGAPSGSAKWHVPQYLFNGPQARRLCADMDNALSLVTNENWQAPGRWRDLQAEVENLWWKTFLDEVKSRVAGNSKVHALFTRGLGPGVFWNKVHWNWVKLYDFDILNCICAKMRKLPETSPFVRAPFKMEDFDPLRSPTRDGDVTRYADTSMEFKDGWVRISGRASPGESRRALVCPSRTMMAALDLFLSTIDIKDFKKLKGYVPGGDWHSRLAHKDQVPKILEQT